MMNFILRCLERSAAEIRVKRLSSVQLSCVLLLGLVVLGCDGKMETVRKDPAESATARENSLTIFQGAEVELSCGQCQFEMEGSGCHLAVRIGGQSYFVDGSSIDDHGDAHGKDGLCNCIRRAIVSGELNDEGRFVASSVKVLPLEQAQE